MWQSGLLHALGCRSLTICFSTWSCEFVDACYLFFSNCGGLSNHSAIVISFYLKSSIMSYFFY